MTIAILHIGEQRFVQLEFEKLRFQRYNVYEEDVIGSTLSD